MSALKVIEGEVDYIVPAAGKKLCKTWYKAIGDFHASNSRRPLVALHGGPGVNHSYLLILSDLTEAHSIPLIVYDQIGNGNSTHLPEKMGDISFWTDQLFLDELTNLLTRLGVKEYDLLGHSWGGMLASRHAAKQSAGMKHLVLASAPASVKLWAKYQNMLRAELPPDVQAVLDEHEKNGTMDSAEYQVAIGVFHSRYLCKVDPLPKPVAEGFEWMQKDPTVFLTMNGPNEFDTTGSLKEWTMIPDAHKINVPTLLTNGRYDEAQDPTVAPFFHERQMGSFRRIKPYVTF